MTMLVKDIINIERGILLGGLNVNNQDPVMSATLNVNGWYYIGKKETVKTYLFHEKDKPSWMRTFKSEDEGVLTIRKRDPWDDWNHATLHEFKIDQPLGVHLGEFYLCKNTFFTKDNPSYSLYSKLLLTTGDFVYLIFETRDINSVEAELT